MAPLLTVLAASLLGLARAGLPSAVSTTEREAGVIREFLQEVWFQSTPALGVLAAAYETGAIVDLSTLQDFEYGRQQLWDASYAKVKLDEGTPNAAGPTSLYWGTEDGSLVEYFEPSDDRGSFGYKMLLGWQCPWDYSSACPSDEPCPAGLAAQPACLYAYDVDAVTGLPSDCEDPVISAAAVVNTSTYCWSDLYTNITTYDPRARPWYADAKAQAGSTSTRAWTTPKVFFQEGAQGLSQQKVVTFSATQTFNALADSKFAGVTASDVSYGAVQEVVDGLQVLYPETQLYLVEADSDLVVAASSKEGQPKCVALDQATSKRATAAECGDGLFAAAEAAEENELWQGVVAFEGEQYWLLKHDINDEFGLNWQLHTLTPVGDKEDLEQAIPAGGWS
ncbi:hypothetical protein M885DRAFT_608658 [Pelagophyceae sp. CCMP2097]|nr:hypothetical protein M885DRAFT_608658 [Pelagophyceae sp. CCMP2097]